MLNKLYKTSLVRWPAHEIS